MRTTPFKTSDYLDSPEMIAAYLTAAIDERDEASLKQAFGNAAEAAKIKLDVDTTNIESVLAALSSLGMRLAVEPK